MKKPLNGFALALWVLTMTVGNGFAESNGSLPNTDLNLPTEFPLRQPNLVIGTGITEADCIKSGGTVGVNSVGTKVCAKKVNALLAGDMDLVKTPSQAIEIGRKACAFYHTSNQNWHARYEDGNWMVWNGHRTLKCREPATTVTVDGRTPYRCARVVCLVPPQVYVSPHF